MDEQDDWDREPLRRNIWDDKLLLVGGGAIVVLILIGAALFSILQRKREAVENAPPPTVEVTPPPIEVQPLPFEPLPVFLLLACAVGIWLLVILVAILTWTVWLRLPPTDDTRARADKIGKPPPM